MNAIERFDSVKSALCTAEAVTAGKLFGKRCLKVDGKAFAAQHLETVVFKPATPAHGEALAAEGAKLWDPSGKGRSMKEWVAVPAASACEFERFAECAQAYVGG
ncbi:MAG: hypothetical protein ACJAYU_000211 [Bradymonadia bacterium]|jgi:hypothetical protein